MSSDSEEDYMADTFLVAPAASANSSRATSSLAKRRHQPLPQPPQPRKRTHIERDARNEGLQTALSADNKGFAMLARMGYKAGQPLGRTAATGDPVLETEAASKPRAGLVEPIAIVLKTDRGGFGRTAALQQLAERRASLRRQRLLEAATGSREAVSTEEFRRRMTARAGERELDADLGKCQRACEKLDADAAIPAPAMPWFWPKRAAPVAPTGEDDVDEPTAATLSASEQQPADVKVDDDDDDDSESADEQLFDAAERLNMLTAYLRTTYVYCHWCAIQYESGDDLQLNCPGPVKDDH